MVPLGAGMAARELDQKQIDRFRAAALARITKAKGKPVSLATLLQQIDGAKASKRAFKAALKDLIASGKIQERANKHYAISTGDADVRGSLKILPSGRSIVIPDQILPEPFSESREIHIPERNRGSALHGDRVRVRLTRQRRTGDAAGRILVVEERRRTHVVGKFLGDDRRARLIPRDDILGRPLEIHGPRPKGADGKPIKNGEWVDVKITRFTDHPEPLIGEIAEYIGSPGSAGLEITVLLRSMGCREGFPPEVQAQANSFPDELPKTEFKHRRDLRDRMLFTMDGADAKDFDDAITIERVTAAKKGGRRETKDPRWLLGVHIADVSHYVEEGTPLDADALDRSTSIYPLDRVVPMLPERLSNNLCSLVPNVDRPAMTCEMEVDASGFVHRYEIYESVIHSRFRLTYEQAQEALDRREQGGRAPRGLGGIMPSLREAQTLARHLAEARTRRGSLDLDLPESKVVLGEDGRTEDIITRSRLETHHIIEEFMLLANETVGRHCERHKIPTLFRVHDKPNMERLEQLAPALRGLGLPVDLRGDWGHPQFQALLDATKKLENGHHVRRLVLRSLMRADYRPENIGHFGLAARTYVHFTSPIRRYPDLLTHRALRYSLRLKPDARKEAFADLRERMPDYGKQTSAQEREAQTIEWDAEAIKSMELMERHVGEEFRGTIVGVASFGAFVELARWPVEGLLRVSSLPGGYWEFDSETLMLRESGSGETLRIGEPIGVRVEKVDVMAGQMDFSFVEHLAPVRISQGRKKTGGKGRGGRKGSDRKAGAVVKHRQKAEAAAAVQHPAQAAPAPNRAAARRRNPRMGKRKRAKPGRASPQKKP